MPPQIVEGDSILQAISMAVGNRPSHLKSQGEEASNTLGFLYLTQELKFLTFKQAQPFNFVRQISLGQTLLIGEGNFSFALSLVKLQPGLSRNIHASVPTAQVHASDQAKTNASTLINRGVDIIYDMDGTKLQNKYAPNTFQTIIFQFPNVASRKPLFNTNPNAVLTRRFLSSAQSVLKTNGKIIITTVDSPHYRGAFQFLMPPKEVVLTNRRYIPSFQANIPAINMRTRKAARVQYQTMANLIPGYFKRTTNDA